MGLQVWLMYGPVGIATARYKAFADFAPVNVPLIEC